MSWRPTLCLKFSYTHLNFSNIENDEIKKNRLVHRICLLKLQCGCLLFDPLVNTSFQSRSSFSNVTQTNTDQWWIGHTLFRFVFKSKENIEEWKENIEQTKKQRLTWEIRQRRKNPAFSPSRRWIFLLSLKTVWIFLITHEICHWVKETGAWRRRMLFSPQSEFWCQLFFPFLFFSLLFFFLSLSFSRKFNEGTASWSEGGEGRGGWKWGESVAWVLNGSVSKKIESGRD